MTTEARSNLQSPPRPDPKGGMDLMGKSFVTIHTYVPFDLEWMLMPSG